MNLVVHQSNRPSSVTIRFDVLDKDIKIHKNTGRIKYILDRHMSVDGFAKQTKSWWGRLWGGLHGGW